MDRAGHGHQSLGFDGRRTSLDARKGNVGIIDGEALAELSSFVDSILEGESKFHSFDYFLPKYDMLCYPENMYKCVLQCIRDFFVLGSLQDRGFGVAVLCQLFFLLHKADYFGIFAN